MEGSAKSSRYGTLGLEIEEPIQEDPQGVTISRWCWLPPSHLISYLPSEFQIQFVHMDYGEHRRLAPACVGIGFIRQAALVGLAMLRARHEPAAMIQTYQLMLLLFQCGPRLRERLDRRLKTLRDFGVTKSETKNDNPLGFELGIGADPEHLWTLSKLLQEGSDAAREADLTQPDFATKMAYGIDRDAAQRPIDLSGRSVEATVQHLRLILFDVGTVPGRVDDSLKERVCSRLWDAIQKHRKDNTEKFDRWFFKKLDNIIKQISKRKKPDGPIKRDRVRQAFLELTFQSFICVGELVSLCTTAIGACFEPSATSERAVFDAIYGSSEYFGDIPLILLAEQIPTIRPSVLAVLEEPQAPERWGRLFRALQTYAEILVRLRELDRGRKGEQPPLRLDRPEEHQDQRQDRDPDWNYLTELLTNRWQRDGVTCRCPGAPNWELSPPDLEPVTEEVDIVMTCQGCGARHQDHYAVSELRQMARES